VLRVAEVLDAGQAPRVQSERSGAVGSFSDKEEIEEITNNWFQMDGSRFQND